MRILRCCYINIKDIYNNIRYNKHTGDSNTLFTYNAITGTNSYFLMKRLGYKEDRINNICDCMNDKKKHKLMLNAKYDKWEAYLSEQGCNSRLCRNCQERQKKIFRAKSREVLAEYKNVRFMTPGFKNVPVLSKEYIMRTSKEFNMFKKYIRRINNIGKYRKILTKILIKGRISKKRYNACMSYYEGKPDEQVLNLLENYIAIMEIKFNRKGSEIRQYGTNKLLGYHKENNWNLHYHMIYDGEYIPVELSSYFLESVTKDNSYFIGIKYVSPSDVRNKQKALNYITKYISKMAFNDDSPMILYGYYSSISHIRFVKVYGINIARRNSYMIKLYEYAKNLYEDHEELAYMLCDIGNFMLNVGIYRYNLEDTKEENYLNFVDDDKFKEMSL